jgi:hypothetical protein
MTGIKVFPFIDLGQAFVANDDAIVFIASILWRYFIDLHTDSRSTEFALIITSFCQLGFQIHSLF